MRRGIRLRYLNRSGEWPSGNPRFYFRRPGGKNIPMPDAPMDSPEFRKAHAEAEQATTTVATHPAGSLGAAITSYLGSPAFARLGNDTRSRRRRDLEDIRARYGVASLQTLTPRNIRTDLEPFAPHPANNRLKTWRGFCQWAVRTGRMDADSAREVLRPELPETEGFTPWTHEEVSAFRAHWPIGTAQRLCFELLFRSCASIGDACRLTKGHIAEGWLIYTRGKSKEVAVVPWANPPAWFGTDDLDACLEGHDHLTFLVTAYGKPRSEKGATQWFSRACTDAGLPHLSAHGVRKHRAASFKERGATKDQRMAILGHSTEAEATRYARSADLIRVISGTDVPTRKSKVFQLGRKKQ